MDPTTQTDSHNLDDILDEASDEMFDDALHNQIESETDESTTLSVAEIPKDFEILMSDFIGDIKTTFPEYTPIIDKWWGGIDHTPTQVGDLFVHCLNVYPGRVNDIIYQTQDIFEDTATVNVDFLPGISFKYLWKCDDISDQIRSTIWKYLQAVLVCVVGSVDKNCKDNGLSSMFNNMDEDAFKNKLKTAVNDLTKSMKCESDVDVSTDTHPDTTGTSVPEIDIQSQLNGLMGGKLGEIAHEIAEETTRGLNLDEFNGSEDVSDVFKKVFSNPGKLMSLVQNVTSKLDTKLKSGDYQQQELIQEATGLLQNMKDMPGMENIQELMSSGLGGGGMGGSGDGGMAGLAEMMSSMMGGGNKGQQGDEDTNPATGKTTKKTNQFTQMKQRIEKKNIQDAIQSQKAIDDLAQRQKEYMMLTDNEIVEMVGEIDKPVAKNKKNRNKK